MKTKQLFIFIAYFLQSVSFSPSISGQNTIYDLSDIDSEFSIIRNYKENIDITYDVYLSTRKFSYFDRSTSLYYYFVIPVEVTDFRIVDGFVYFCGGSISQSGYVIGWFDIHNTFIGSDNNIKYIYIPPVIGVNQICR